MSKKMSKDRRFVIVLIALLFTIAVGIIAVINGMESVAITSVSAAMGESGAYIAGESYKPSETK